MSNDIERFINLIFMTNYMNNLLFKKDGGVEANKDIVEILDWNKFKSVQEIIDLNNQHINNAIKEILNNEKLVKILKDETNINI